MIVFETRAGKEIDLDAVEMVLLGKYTEPRFLDVVTGKVESDPGVMRVEILVFPKERFEKEMRSFIEMMIVGEDEDKEVVVPLTALLKGKEVYDKAMHILQTDEAWMISWREWISTGVWEELRAWLLSVDSGIVEVVTFDCSCALCHDMARSIEGDPQTRVEWDFDHMKEKESELQEK